MTTTGPSIRTYDLVARLTELAAREDRAGLAALRRGLGHEPGTVAEMYPYVEPFLTADAPRARVAAFYLVASLFGLHPVHAEAPGGYAARHGFGATLRAIRLRPESPEEDTGVAKRFTALLECDRSALSVHLRHMVTLLRSRAEGAPIDYRQFWRDILAWDAPDRRVQRAWAAGFWGQREEEMPREEHEAPGGETDD